MSAKGIPVIAIHGGCGAVKGVLNPIMEADVNEAMTSALTKGIKTLTGGGTAVEAVKVAIVELENCPWFNAGKGSVYTVSGRHDLDAGLMDGKTRTAGGVTYAHRIKNPICAADIVRTKTRHAIFAGDGAEELAARHGLELVPEDYFDTEYRRKQLDYVLASGGSGAVVPALDHDVAVAAKMETVGAVALDSFGDTAGGSSTGGQTGKGDGRVSDSAIAGAGFFANKDFAVSGTGDGDFFIRRATCATLAERYKHLKDCPGPTFVKLCHDIICEDLKDCGAGLVAVDRAGTVAMPYNTVGMFRGYFRADMDTPSLAIWKENDNEKGLDILG